MRGYQDAGKGRLTPVDNVINLRWLASQLEASRDSVPFERRKYFEAIQHHSPFLLPTMRVLPASNFLESSQIRRSNEPECGSVSVGDLPEDALVVYISHDWTAVDSTGSPAVDDAKNSKRKRIAKFIENFLYLKTLGVDKVNFTTTCT